MVLILRYLNVCLFFISRLFTSFIRTYFGWF